MTEDIAVGVEFKKFETGRWKVVVRNRFESEAQAIKLSPEDAIDVGLEMITAAKDAMRRQAKEPKKD